METYYTGDSVMVAKGKVERNRNLGPTTCPCCGTRLRDQEIHLDRSLIEQLQWFVENHTDGAWVDVPAEAPRWMIKRRTFNRLRYFGLLQKKDYTHELSPVKAGMWRLTLSGFKFADDQLWVPEYVKVRNGKVIEKSNRLIGIKIALQTEVVEV